MNETTPEPVADPPLQESDQGHGNANGNDKSDNGAGNANGNNSGEDNPGKGHDKNK